MQVPVYSLAGEVVKNIEISDRVFAVSFNHYSIDAGQINRRAEKGDYSAGFAGAQAAGIACHRKT